MRVLVTGGTGFIGRHVVSRLRADGHEVLLLKRLLASDDGASTSVQEFIAPQEGRREALASMLDGVDAVFHLAAVQTVDPADAFSLRVCLDTNVALCAELLQASVIAHTKRFIYFSVGNAYADGSAQPATEHDALYPAQTSPYYLGTKVLAEILVEHYRLHYSLHTISLRLSSVFGFGMPRDSVVSTFIHRAVQSLPLVVNSGGKHQTDFVYVDDVVELAVASLHSGEAGVYNVGSGYTTSVLELANSVNEVFGSTAPHEILSSNASAQRGFRPLNIEKVKSMWNFAPTLLKDGLKAIRRMMDPKTQFLSSS